LPAAAPAPDPAPPPAPDPFVAGSLMAPRRRPRAATARRGVALSAVALLAAACRTPLRRPVPGPGASGSTGPEGASAKRLNVVLVLTDDQRFDTLWAMPNVRRLLVRHGMLF